MLIKYKGPGRMIINLILGTSTSQLKIPLILEDLTLSGKLHLDFTFFQKSPFLHTLSYCFSSVPEFDIHVRPLSTVNLMWVPIAKEWIRDMFISAFKRVLVMPVKLSLSYHKLFPSKDVRSDAHRHQLAIERAISDNVYDGSLHIRILEARKLPCDFLEDINPYVILSFADQVYTTKMSVKNKNPMFNEFCEFVVFGDKPRILEVIVMSRDEQVGDKLLGQCTVDSVADLKMGSEVVESWMELVILNKKGQMKPVGGDIRLQLRYVPDPTKSNSNMNQNHGPVVMVNRV
jgi:Ca2+-dependent lipid-binding protein